MTTRKNHSSRRKTTNTKRRVTKKEQEMQLQKAHAFREEILLWSIVAISLVLFISNFGVGGSVGNSVSSFFFGVFGIIAYIFPILLFVGTFFGVSNKDNPFAILKLIAAILFVLFICFFMELVITGSNVVTPKEAYTYSAENKIGGGFIGGTFSYLMVPAFGLPGCYIIDVVVLIITIVLITEKSALKGFKKGGQKVYESAKENTERYQEIREQRQEERAKRRMDKKVSGVSSDITICDKKKEDKTDEVNEILIEDYPDLPEIKEEKRVKIPSDTAKPIFPPEPELASNMGSNMESALDQVVISGEFQSDDQKEKTVLEPAPAAPKAQTVTKAPVHEPAHEKEKVSAQELEKEVEEVANSIQEEEPVQEYVYPPIDLLKPGSGKKSGNTEAQLRETAMKLQQTLKNFGVNVTVTNISCGPAVTRYEIQPEMGVKVSKIVNLADDIKLNLAAADIRIEAPIPGKAAVGIEVPNKENVMVPFRELVESEEFQKSKSKISFAVGKDIAGKVKVTDIAKMPHLLIAGATGSGKSVCINTIIMSILYKADPNEVKLIMIDPKVVELSVYNGIPHLMIPVVTEPKKAAGALHWAVAEMTERYNKFAEANVREINGYNTKVESIQVPEGQERPKKMPQIVIIVDELADLMMVASNDVEEAICRLAQLARAAGIHLVIATQRPSVNVITGLIKANMPSRIAFAVTSGTDSRTILDMNGAEKLLGKGDMLFNPQGVPKPIRVQGAFVSDKEVSDVVGFLTENNGHARYSDDIQAKLENMQSSSNNSVSISDNDAGDDGRDAYFMEAAKILMDKEKASIGMLQRYLKVGFNRAARIMDQLEEAGIVGPEEGTKPRKIMMSPEEFEQFVDEN